MVCVLCMHTHDAYVLICFVVGFIFEWPKFKIETSRMDIFKSPTPVYYLKFWFLFQI